MGSRPRLGEDVRNLSLIILAAWTGVAATVAVAMAGAADRTADVAVAPVPVRGSVVRVEMSGPAHRAVVLSRVDVPRVIELKELRERRDVRELREVRELVEGLRLHEAESLHTAKGSGEGGGEGS